MVTELQNYSNIFNCSHFNTWQLLTVVMEVGLDRTQHLIVTRFTTSCLILYTKVKGTILNEVRLYKSIFYKCINVSPILKLCRGSQWNSKDEVLKIAYNGLHDSCTSCSKVTPVSLFFLPHVRQVPALRYLFLLSLPEQFFHMTSWLTNSPPVSLCQKSLS